VSPAEQGPVPQSTAVPTAGKNRNEMLNDEAESQQKEMMSQNRRQASTKLTTVSIDQRSELRWLATKTTKFEDFDVLRTLGEGGFGKVLLVSKKIPEQDEPSQFALKVLKKSFIVDSGNVTRALAEKELLQSLRHPFIVRLYHAFMSDMHLFLCMTYVGGGELYSLMEQFQNFRHQGIPEAWGRFYGTEIALALDHLHKNGVLYRDLKPENVLIALDGHVCLTDFGLAMDRLEEEGANEIAGTPCYIAPDVLGDEGPNEAVDWWSFGIILYELLFGTTPFGVGMATVEAIFDDIQQGELKFPDHAKPDLIDVLSRLLDRDRATRLCMGKKGFIEMEEHPWFALLNFDEVLHKRVKPPYQPGEVIVKTTQIDTDSIIRPQAGAAERAALSPEELRSIDELAEKFGNFKAAPAIQVKVEGINGERTYEGSTDLSRLRLTQVF
jgi:serine/threonine protein kinase